MAEVSERFIDVGPFRTRYLEGGEPSAPTVLLLHDGTWGGASSVTWGTSAGLLAERYHVLAPDMLGYGGTDKAVFVDRSQYEGRLKHLLAFLKAVGATGPMHLVGSSFGGSLVLRALAAQAPIQVRSATTICGTGGPWKTELQMAELPHWDGSEPDLARIVAHLMDADAPGFDEQVRERMRWAANIGHYRAIKAVRLPVPDAVPRPQGDDDWLARLADVRVPVLLVAGARDTLLESDWPEHLRSRIPSAQVAVIDSKHSPNLDRHDELMPTLLDFLGVH